MPRRRLRLRSRNQATARAGTMLAAVAASPTRSERETAPNLLRIQEPPALRDLQRRGRRERVVERLPGVRHQADGVDDLRVALRGERGGNADARLDGRVGRVDDARARAAL